MVGDTRKEVTMVDTQAREATEALIAILGSAASMGIDIHLLCRWAVDELNDGTGVEKRAFALGAIYQIGRCMEYVVDP